MATTMKAVIVKQPGDASQLAIGDVEKPVPSPTQLLVKVHTFALNRMDILQRHGNYPAPFGASQILGVEFSGVIDTIGAQVSAGTFTKGQPVFGLVYGGAYAEYVVIDHRMALALPPHLDHVKAAAIPEVWFTAYQALSAFNCDLKEGETALIHAGASGVGTAACQLAREVFGAGRIIATAGSDAKCAYLRDNFGVDAINYKTEDWAQRVEELTGGKGADVIVDFIGASYWEKNLKSLKVDGRMVMLAFLGGAKLEESNLGLILRKRLTVRWLFTQLLMFDRLMMLLGLLQIKGSSLRSRDPEYQYKLRDQIVARCLPLFETGKLRPIIEREFKWGQIREAHELLESNTTIGKIVVHVE
ncbi:hypothetical protein HK101_003462 [Irineochytrium annulatum]|nr:hypothetical protein HK101_003462 [Irineochytrium annulatum]